MLPLSQVFYDALRGKKRVIDKERTGVPRAWVVSGVDGNRLGVMSPSGNGLKNCVTGLTDTWDDAAPRTR